MTDLISKVLKGDIRAIGKAVTIVESEKKGKEELIDSLYPHCGNAVVWGITGPPGAGKSSLLDKIVQIERKKGKKIAVIAIDPSSPFSGGAILGDRIRMQKHATDEGVFIRSMASRGHLGGVSGATGDAIKVFDAAGYDLIIIETIGVGQTEVEVMELSDIVMLVLVPGLGDEIQALKAGVMEIGDVFVINKSDKDDAMKVKREVEYVLSIKYMNNPEDINPVVMTSVTKNFGITELVDSVYSYYEKSDKAGKIAQKRKKRLTNEISRIIAGKLQNYFHSFLKDKASINELVESLYTRKTGPYILIDRVINEFFNNSDIKIKIGDK